jgi:PGF-pre-PGF domain-containing protein|tara:strand:- start:2460 stop:4106 length:1647 start_codon:yes stop_codon:yes gene_type:complete
MDNKKILLLMFFGIFFVLSMYSVSAHLSALTVTSNETNGSSWQRGGDIKSFNYTIAATGNSTINISYINFSLTVGNLFGVTVASNNSNWTCDGAVINSSYANCSSVTSAANTAANITLNITLNSTALEQNHTMTISIMDNFSTVNTTRMLLEIDNIDPTITTPFYQWYMNSTSIKNVTTDSLIFNISVADSGSGGSQCHLNFNDSNQSVAVSSGWCNTTLGNLTGLSDGNQTILLYINDSVNNLILNSTLVIQIDSVNPSPTASCTPANPTDNGETVTCSCSGTDATSGINSSLTTADLVTVTSTAGSTTYTCYVRDFAGNNASDTDTFIVTGGSSGGAATSSGGDSGTVSSVKSNIFSTVTPEKVSVMKNFAEETGVKEIKIEVNNEVKNVKVTVSKYDEKPAEVSVEKTGKVYQYMQINTENLVDNLKKAIITIKVEKTWLSDSGLEKENIILSKFDESSSAWNELVTTYKEDDDTYYYYDVELTSFSYFAISEKVVEEVVEDKGIGTILGEKISEEVKNLSWLWVVIAILAVLAVFVIFKRTKKK